jgi:hypothetical protein
VQRSVSRRGTVVWVVTTVATLWATLALASPFGINAHVPNDAVLDRVVEAGIEWVRIDFLWSTVEAERDVYDWRVYDALVDRLEVRGLKGYATLQGTPAWATSGSEFSGVPDDVAQWQEFVYLAAKRYRGRIAAWGMWNEPNLKHFWEGSRTDYIEKLLIPGSRAVRTADPGALVCGPDLAHLSNGKWDTWLRDVITRAGGSLDVVTHHFYPSHGRPSELVYAFDRKPHLPWSSPAVRDLLVETGWWGRPFWLTETGVQSGVEGPSDQADFYDSVVEDWFGSSPEARWIDRIFFYQMHDGRDPAPTTFGILRGKPDLEAKPAFFAYRNVIAATRTDDADVLDLRAATFTLPGRRAEVQVLLRNTGTSTWDGSAGYHVDTRVDSDTWKVDTGALPRVFEVPPGATALLNIPVDSPSALAPGASTTVVLEARLVADNGRRFGDPIRVTMTATDNAPPVIRNSPRNLVIPESRRLTLTVNAGSDTPLTFRWRRNSVELADSDRVRGSRTSLLTLSAVDASLEGDYDCLVTNNAGTVVATIATVTLGTPNPRHSDSRRSSVPTF